MDVVKKTINNTISKLDRPTKLGPNKCPVYLRLPYLGKEVKFLENKVKETVNGTFGAVNLQFMTTSSPFLPKHVTYINYVY